MQENTKGSKDPISELYRHWVDQGFGQEAAAMAIISSFMRVQQIFLARTTVILRPLGLTLARYEVLIVLLFANRGSVPLNKIADRLQVTAASVTNVITRLEAEGFVVRVENPDDGRESLAKMTPKGRRLVKSALKAMNAELFSDIGLGKTEMSDLMVTLDKIRKAAGDFGEVRGHVSRVR